MFKSLIVMMLAIVCQQHMLLNAIKLDQIMNKPFHIDQFDAIFKQVEKEMENKMSAMIKLSGLMMEDSVVEQKVEATTTEIQPIEEALEIKETPKVKDYEQCITILEQILFDCGEIAKVIERKEWSKIFALLIDLSDKIMQDVKCFENADKIELVQDYAVSFFNMVGDKKQCVIDHLNDIMADLRSAVHALIEGNMEKVKQDLTDAYNTYLDIQNCQ
jgi:hypothetical protein